MKRNFIKNVMNFFGFNKTIKPEIINYSPITKKLKKGKIKEEKIIKVFYKPFRLKHFGNFTPIKHFK